MLGASCVALQGRTRLASATISTADLAKHMVVMSLWAMTYTLGRQTTLGLLARPSPGHCNVSSCKGRLHLLDAFHLDLDVKWQSSVPRHSSLLSVPT